MGIRVLIIIAILCMSGCKTKEKTVETKVDLQQHTWQYDKSQLKLDETITLFDILINDSDTIATPKKMIRRRANIQQEDTTQKIMYFTQNKKSSQRRTSHFISEFSIRQCVNHRRYRCPLAFNTRFIFKVLVIS